MQRFDLRSRFFLGPFAHKVETRFKNFWEQNSKLFFDSNERVGDVLSKNTMVSKFGSCRHEIINYDHQKYRIDNCDVTRTLENYVPIVVFSDVTISLANLEERCIDRKNRWQIKHENARGRHDNAIDVSEVGSNERES
ncbi:hypothetical protein ACOME3_001487 [Neoechinorhynchus agilis]